MLCPHCQNNDPSLFEVEEIPGRPGIVLIICKVCSKEFQAVAPKDKV